MTLDAAPLMLQEIINFAANSPERSVAKIFASKIRGMYSLSMFVRGIPSGGLTNSSEIMLSKMGGQTALGRNLLRALILLRSDLQIGFSMVDLLVLKIL